MLKRTLKTMTRVVLSLVVTILILTAVVVNLMHFGSVLLNRHQAPVERWLTHMTKKPIQVKGLKVGWYHYQPVLVLKGVQLDRNNHQKLLHINKVIVQFDFWTSLMQWRVVPTEFSIDGLQLDLYRSEQGRWRFNDAGADKKLAAVPVSTIHTVMAWLLSEDQITMTHMTLLLHANNGHILRLQNATLVGSNRHDLHRYQLTAHGDGLGAQGLNLKMFFSGDAFDPVNTTLHLYVHLESVDLSRLYAWNKVLHLEERVRSLQGRGSVDAWMRMKRWRISTVAATLALLQFRAQLEHVQHPISLDAFKGTVWLDRVGRAVNVLLNSQTLRLNQQSYTPGLIKLRYAADANRLISVSARQMPVTLLQETLRHIRKGAALSSKLSVDRGNLSVDMQHVGDAWQGDVQTQNLKLHVPQAYSAPHALDRVDLHFAWLPSQHLLQLPRLTIQSPWWRAHAHARVDMAGVPRIDLQGRFALSDLSRVSALFPDKLIDPDLSQWLFEAFGEGTLQRGRILWRGPLSTVPYRHHEGVFDVSAQVQSQRFTYLPNWPATQSMRSVIQVHNNRLSIEDFHAKTVGVTVSRLSAEIPNLMEPRITVHLQAGAPFPVFKTWLAETPLPFKHSLDDLKLAGASALDLTVSSNLYGTDLKLQDRGIFTLNQVSGTYHSKAFTLTSLSGGLQFSQATVHGLLRGQLNKHPLTLHFMPRSLFHPGAPDLALKFDGVVDLGNDLKLQNNWFQNHFTGAVPYTALYSIWYDAPAKNRLEMVSHLQGMQIDLGKVYHKSKEMALWTRLVAGNFPGKKQSVELSLGAKLKAQLQLGLRDGTFAPMGLISYGIKAPGKPPHDHLRLRAQLPALKLAQWWPLLSSFHAGMASATVPLNVQVDTPVLWAGGQHFTQVKLGMKPVKGDWRIHFHSRWSDGQITLSPWSLGSGIRAHFKRLVLRKMSAHKKGDAHFSVQGFPQLDISADQLIYDSMDYGEFLLKTKTHKDTLQIKALALSPSSCQIHLKGAYVGRGDQSHSTAEGKVTCDDFGRFLRDQGLTTVLFGGKGHLVFDLRWDDAWTRLMDAALSGQMQFDLKEGVIEQLTQSEKSALGLGKLLNVFSLSDLPDRLSYGFRDIRSQGFVFKQINAHLNLERGVAHVDPIQLNSTVADMTGKGRIDFMKKAYALNLKVLPHMTSNLPVLATVAGGPVAGLATFFADKLISPVVSHATAKHIHLKGHWKKHQSVDLPKPSLS